jgi:uncharacterized protein YggE
MNTYLSESYAKFLLSLALVAVVVALSAYAYQMFTQTSPHQYEATINVSGEGEVLAVPDVGQFSFSVNAEAETAAEAQEQSGTAINEILAYLREQGIEDKDIKTQNYNLSPRYRFEPTVCPVGSFCNRERVQDGFEVTQTISVKVRNTDDAGAIIAGVGERGATNISRLDFVIDDVDSLREEAREIAIRDAREKAERLANDLGVSLKRVVNFSEGGGYYEPYFQERAVMALDASEAGFGGAELPMGEESTTVRVNITYEIK